MICFNFLQANTSLHYALVESPHRLLSSRIYRTVTVGKGSTKQLMVKADTVQNFICFNCFGSQRTKGGHKEHMRICLQNEEQAVELPEPGETLSFSSGEKNCEKMFKSAFLLFFDFESLQSPMDKPCNCSDEVVENTERKFQDEKSVRTIIKQMRDEERVSYAASLAMADGNYADVYDYYKFAANEGGIKFIPPPAYRKV